MKTPMQEMIEWLDKMSRNASSIGMGTGDLELAMMHAKSMLEKEKEVMCQFADEFSIECTNSYSDRYASRVSIEQFFNTTFNTTDQ
jgi:hypothetical protein